jgi:prepilin-type N-terminal cleavage/methylation domain-containing protein
MNNKGFTLIELLVSLAVTSLIMLGVVQSYSLAVSRADDQKIRLLANLQAKAVLESVGAELRTLGNGVPFDQANFQIGENTLGDVTATEPIIIAGTDLDEITFRLNESGKTHLLTSDFDPTFGFRIYLTDVDNLKVGRTVYITNSVMGGDDGFRGTINSIDTGSKSILVDAGANFSPGATFVEGSLLEQVSVLKYENLGGAVMRSNDSILATMAPNSTISFRYLSQSGVPVALPLTHDSIVNTLRTIEVVVVVTSTRKQSNGEFYSITVRQTFGLRNLAYLI